VLLVVVRLLADASLIAALLFGPAGTLSWGRAWLLVAAWVVMNMVSAILVYPVHRALLVDRARLPIHRDQRPTDKLLLLAGLATGFIALPAVAAFDVFHWHLLARPTPLLANFGLVLFIVGWSVRAAALRANAFATTTVRLQHERQHALVDRGIYAHVRHPFYLGTSMALVGVPLWLESFAALLFALVPIAIMLLRIAHEERVLADELPGYSEYARRVPYRVMPRIW